MAGLVEGLGFEELGGPGDTGSKPLAQLWITGSVNAGGDLIIGGVGSMVGSLTGSAFIDDRGALHPVAINNATAAYGYRVLAGSVKTGDDQSGLIVFSTPFATNEWHMTISPAEMSDPYTYQPDLSGLVPCVSGAKRASGCWIRGGSVTVFDWIAVGL